MALRLETVHERIRLAGGSAEAVRIVAVTKGFGPDAVTAAVEVGLLDVGENYADELLAKHRVAGSARSCRWHFLGRVQRNKVSRLAPLVALWHGVDRVSAGREIARRSGGAKVLVQINLSEDASRNGCHFEEVPALTDDLCRLDLEVVGLMAVGPAGPPEDARPGFRRLVAMAEKLGLPERSMGMTDDLEVAVQEGTTMVRLGRALFGERAPATAAPLDGPIGLVATRGGPVGPEIARRAPLGSGSGDRLKGPRRRV